MSSLPTADTEHMSKRPYSQLRLWGLGSSGVIGSRKELSAARQIKSWKGQRVLGDEYGREEPAKAEQERTGMTSPFFCLVWTSLLGCAQGSEKHTTWDQCFSGDRRRSKKPLQKTPNPEWR